MRFVLSLFCASLAALAAGPSAAERPFEEERYERGGRSGAPILLVATDFRDRLIGCRVIFRLANRSGRNIGRAMFKVQVGPGGQTRRVYLWTGSYKDYELFTGTPCGQLRRELRLAGAWCRWRGTMHRADCTRRTRLLIEGGRR